MSATTDGTVTGGRRLTYCHHAGTEAEPELPITATNLLVDDDGAPYVMVNIGQLTVMILQSLVNPATVNIEIDHEGLGDHTR